MTRLLIVGYGGEVHVGLHLLQAAQQLGHEVQLFDASAAYHAPRPLPQINWRLRGHRPTHLDSFSRSLIERCDRDHPEVVLVTGITPPNASTLMRLRSLGIRCLNYLTDDPWNASQRAHWFFEAIPHYTHIFSPRQSNLDDLARAGGTASYLPFAYSPTIHYRESAPPAAAGQFECDVLFYGGADRDRVPYIKALIDAGLQVHLYGGYWERDAQTRAAALGMADTKTLRWAVSGAKVTLCLVRRANRDGHVMRTFEAPAMGACLLTEDTEEQRAILHDTALYFRSTEDLLAGVQQLLQDAPLRTQLAQRAEQRIVQGKNTYLDRLQTMLSND